MDDFARIDPNDPDPPFEPSFPLKDIGPGLDVGGGIVLAGCTLPDHNVRVPACLKDKGSIETVIDRAWEWTYFAQRAVIAAINALENDQMNVVFAFWNYDADGGGLHPAPRFWFGDFSADKLRALRRVLDYVADRYTSRWRPLIVHWLQYGTGEPVDVLWDRDPDSSVIPEGRIGISTKFFDYSVDNRAMAWQREMFVMNSWAVDDAFAELGIAHPLAYAYWTRHRWMVRHRKLLPGLDLTDCALEPEHPCFIHSAGVEDRLDVSVGIGPPLVGPGPFGVEEQLEAIRFQTRRAYEAISYGIEFLETLAASPETTRRVLWELGYNCGWDGDPAPDVDCSGHADCFSVGNFCAAERWPGRELFPGPRRSANPSLQYFFGPYSDTKLQTIYWVLTAARARMESGVINVAPLGSECSGGIIAHHIIVNNIVVCQEWFDRDEFLRGWDLTHEFFHHVFAGTDFELAQPKDRFWGSGVPCGDAGTSEFTHACYRTWNARRLVLSEQIDRALKNVDNYNGWVWGRYTTFGPCLVPKGCAFPAPSDTEEGGHSHRCWSVGWTRLPPSPTHWNTPWPEDSTHTDPLYPWQPSAGGTFNEFLASPSCCEFHLHAPHGWDPIECPATERVVCGSSPTGEGQGLLENNNEGICMPTGGGGGTPSGGIGPGGGGVSEWDFYPTLPPDWWD